MDISLSAEKELEQLIQACMRQERWAQKKLYEQNYSKYLAVCLRYSNNMEDAQDILHDGFIKVFKNIRKFKEGTSFLAWSKRIFINTAIDFYRKSTRRRTEDLDEVLDAQVDELDVVSKLSADEILNLVQYLTPAYRMVFNLYVMEGYSHKEIADMLDITESTSRSNLVKARTKLKDLLRNHLNYE